MGLIFNSHFTVDGRSTFVVLECMSFLLLSRPILWIYRFSPRPRCVFVLKSTLQTLCDVLCGAWKNGEVTEAIIILLLALS